MPVLALRSGWQLAVCQQVVGLARRAHRRLPWWMTTPAAAVSAVEEEEEGKGGSKRSRRRRRQHAAGRPGWADVPGVGGGATGAQSTPVDTAASPVRSTPPAAAKDEFAPPAATAAPAVSLPPS